MRIADRREANLEPADRARLTALAYVHHRAGRHSESDQALRQLESEWAADAAYQLAVLPAARAEVVVDISS